MWLKACPYNPTSEALYIHWTLIACSWLCDSQGSDFFFMGKRNPRNQRYRGRLQGI